MTREEANNLEMLRTARISTRNHVPARTRRPTGASLPAAAIIGAMLLLAGCGGSSTSSSTIATSAPSGAGGSGAAPTSSSNRLEQFAQCMRSHGEPNFPDPTPQGKFNLPARGVTAGSPQFQAADQACKSLAPAGALSGQAPPSQQVSQTVKFVACMRKNGV